MFRDNPRRAYLILEFLRSGALGTILPIFALYYRHFEITIFQIALLAAAFEATILLLEIPTGIWADRYSRRLAILISEICLTIAGVLFLGLPGLVIFLFAEIIQGCGEAFGSGSLEAWVVDELGIAIDRERTEALFASALRWKTIALFIGALIGGLIAGENLRWAWAPFVFLHFSAMLMVMISLRPTGHERNQQLPRGSWREIVRSGTKRLRASSVLKILIGFGLITAFAEEGIDQFWQVFTSENLAIQPGWFGLIVAIPALAIFLFAPTLTRKMGRLLSPGKTVALWQVVLSTGLVGFILFTSLPAICCLVLVMIARDLKRPIISSWANREIESQHRAGMLSFFNMISSTGEVLAGILFGFLAQQAGLSSVFLVAAAISLAAALLLFGVDRDQQSGTTKRMS